MLEGAIAITAGVHLASAKSNIITMLDLDSVNLLAYNPINVGTQFNGSEIILGDDYGLGSEIPNR